MKSKNHVRTVSGKPSATSGGILGYYWSLTLSDESSSNYMLGFYSPLSYAPLTDNEFWLDYEHDIFTWEEQGDTTGKYN